VAEEAGKVVILGVGNRLRGDDAVGCILCDEIRNSPQRYKDTKPGPESDAPLGGHSFSDRVHVIDCGDTPENYIQPIAELNPARILVIDCCNYGGQPGEFRLFSRAEVDSLSYGLLSTHTLPLTLTIEMLSLETHATIELLGIHPERIEFGEEMSEPVKRALPAVVEFVRNWARASQPGA
jgi:hydrogenase 3 maturation protease